MLGNDLNFGKFKNEDLDEAPRATLIELFSPIKPLPSRDFCLLSHPDSPPCPR
jgi:hypothetical protein